MKLWCFSRKNAREFYREKMGWYYREDIPEDTAVISIAGTPEIQEKYLKDNEEHWFEEGPNVLNLNFDDVAEDEFEYNGFMFYGLTMADARRAVEFIVRNQDKNFYVNCRAGKSRSQAFIQFILDCFPDRENELNPENPPCTPNIDVLTKLKRIYLYEH
jgi:protein tyrosine/serine phosphatase